MVPRNHVVLALFLVVSSAVAQTPAHSRAAVTAADSRPTFKVLKKNPHLPVLSQERTNTCWSFGTVSMLESEIQRVSGKEVDLSEMWFARMGILEKAERFVLLQGNGRFDEGGLAHDVTEILRKHGALPIAAFTGLPKDCTTLDHAPLWKDLQLAVKPLVAPSSKLPTGWRTDILSIADRHLGSALPFKVDPKTFSETLGIKGEDYVEVMSDAHLPFDDQQELLVPDNWLRWQKFRNRPIDDFVMLLKDAIRSGATASIDCDVSEPGFQMERGVADVLADSTITQESRDAAFQSRDTTDDHLMHAVGLAEDEHGKTWFLVKNSWGKSGPYAGYLYMSERYLRMKCLNFMVHRAFVPEHVKKS